jgi:hypothetical protein
MLLILSRGSVNSQEKNYESIFGKDWIRAESFITENESWMRQMSGRYHISYLLASAVVFPELIRYSALRDKIETTLLKTLYVNLGSEYVNFSIGPFQMKPSFAEYICSRATELKERPGNEFRKKGYREGTSESRKSIVMDLEKADIQFVYLAAFIKICERSYDLGKAGDEEKVRMLSSAYNCGPDKSPEKVKEMASKKFFNTKLYSTENYSYSDISLYWFRKTGNK